MSERRSYYELLNAPATASYDELKTNYKQLILQCHPDKLHTDNDSAASASGNNGRCAIITVDDPKIVADSINEQRQEFQPQFVAINEAWQTLKDANKRKLYDAELMLMKFQTHSNIYARLRLDEMLRQPIQGGDDNNGRPEEERNEAEAEGIQSVLTWCYTHPCRCGGLFIIDESEISSDSCVSNGSDNEEQYSNGKNDKSDENRKHSDGVNRRRSSRADNADDDDEVMVECNECSLVIILERARPQN